MLNDLSDRGSWRWHRGRNNARRAENTARDAGHPASLDDVSALGYPVTCTVVLAVTLGDVMVLGTMAKS